MSEYIGYKTPMFGQKLANGEDALVTVLTDEEVIRCRDCKKSRIEKSDHEYRARRWCRLHEMYVRDESFCSWADRRTR